MRNIDVHDIICMMGECIVAGGVRRSALISLSDLDDPEIRDAKKGAFYMTHPHRSLANNSAVYINKPTNEEFLKEWMALIAEPFRRARYIQSWISGRYFAGAPYQGIEELQGLF